MNTDQPTPSLAPESGSGQIPTTPLPEAGDAASGIETTIPEPTALTPPPAWSDPASAAAHTSPTTTGTHSTPGAAETPGTPGTPGSPGSPSSPGSPTAPYAAGPAAAPHTTAPPAPASKRHGPRPSPIIWGVLILAFCGYVAQTKYGATAGDPAVWAIGGILAVGVLLLAIGAVVLIRNRKH